MRPEIDTRKAKYEHHSDELDEALERLETQDEDDNEDQWNQLAPNVQAINYEDTHERTNESTSNACFNPNDQVPQYDIGRDLEVPSTTVQLEVIPKRMPDEEYYELVRTLNKEQQAFFYHVLHWLKTRETPLYAFLSGGAGVGKTRVVKALHQAILRMTNTIAGEKPDDMTVLLCAPTGKAAFNIGGSTIHSAFMIPASQGFKSKPLSASNLNTLRNKVYPKLQVVIIDEISMVGHDLFNLINSRLQQIKDPKHIFGGVSVIVCGDLFQLKPVFDGWIFKRSPNSYGPIASNLWEEHFPMFELTEVMRQKDDQPFAALLNRLREGKHTKEDLNTLKTHVISQSTTGTEIQTAPHIFTTNEQVDTFNQTVFEQSTAEKVVIPAQDSVVGDVDKEVKMKMKAKIPSMKTSNTMGLLFKLPVAVGLRYELTINVKTDDGLTNGAPGTMKKIDHKGSKTRRPSILWVDFEDTKVGTNWRKDHKHLYSKDVNPQWTPVLEVNRDFPVGHIKKAKALRKQFPVRPAAAKTVHKCQGDTLPKLVVHLGERKREHIHYVGLSRVTNIANLHILQLAEHQISVSTEVLQEMKHLRGQRRLQLCVPNLSESPNSFQFHIAFHNTRSLHLHIDELRNDKNMTSADLLCIVESWLMSQDCATKYNIDQYHTYRMDYPTKGAIRPHYGTVIYSKRELTYQPEYHAKKGMEITTFDLTSPLPCRIAVVYKSPQRTLPEITKFLCEILENRDEDKSLIILGDFNVDHRTSSLVTTMMNKFACRQVLQESTTDDCTNIDHIYTDLSNNLYQAGVLESYYSNHKPVFITLATK